MAGYTPSIYLRNKFRMKWDKEIPYLQMFLEGKEKFLRETKTKPKGMRWRLIAAFAEWPLFKDTPVIQRSCDMFQVWRLDTWHTLYQTMVDLSETRWYRELGRSLASEDQDLLINAGVLEPPPDFEWDKADKPGYAYVYEVARANEGQTHAYLRELNWFTAQMAKIAGWKMVWWATKVTAQPAELSVLWRIPDPGVKHIPQHLVEVARERKRYPHQTALVQETSRRIYYPIYTEYLDQNIPAPTT